MSQDPDPRMRDPYGHLDGPYLLGALTAEERADYESHLRDCATCRAGLEEIRSVLPYLAAADESVLDGGTPGLAPRHCRRRSFRNSWSPRAASAAGGGRSSRRSAHSPPPAWSPSRS